MIDAPEASSRSIRRAHEVGAHRRKQRTVQPDILSSRLGDRAAAASLLGGATNRRGRGKYRIVAYGDPRSRLDDAGSGGAGDTLEGRHQAAASTEKQAETELALAQR